MIVLAASIKLCKFASMEFELEPLLAAIDPLVAVLFMFINACLTEPTISSPQCSIAESGFLISWLYSVSQYSVELVLEGVADRGRLGNHSK